MGNATNLNVGKTSRFYSQASRFQRFCILKAIPAIGAGNLPLEFKGNFFKKMVQKESHRWHYTAMTEMA